MTLWHVLRTLALMAVLPTLLPAQVIKQATQPLDYTKQADVNGKTVHFGDLQYGTVPQPSRTWPASQPIRESPTASPLSKGNLQLQSVELNEVKPNSVELSTLSRPVLPQANFTAKRAAADKTNDQGSRQLEQSKQNAPITNRVIRPFTPGGEEELKNQLNKLHP